jgi:hypothetical protein
MFAVPAEYILPTLALLATNILFEDKSAVTVTAVELDEIV